MFCEKCGTKNEKTAKFCASCGNKLVIENNTKDSKKEQKANKIKSLPKKTKIIMWSVITIAVIGVIILGILLNNPVKKIEDNLAKFYDNYGENSDKKLEEIGKVLKSNKEKAEVLNKIKETTYKITDKRIKNFNTEYKNLDSLRESYNKVNGAIKDIYEYFNGLEYMLDKETYQNYKDELSKLYSSKVSYLNGLEEENKDNSYYAYYNYQKVDESDSYYKKAQEFINNYVKDELETYKKKVEEIITTKENKNDEELLSEYQEQLKYLKNNKTSNNIDLSITDTYKDLYSKAEAKILELTKKIITELEKKDDYNNIIKIIDDSIKTIDNNSKTYKELEDLKSKYQDKLPDSLLDKYVVAQDYGTSSSKYSKTLNDKEYDSNISFVFNGKSISRTYRLNEEYKKFKTTIVRGPDWDKSFKGHFVITGDGKELYKSAEITKNSDLKADIEIDVTGVDDLKIEFVTSSKPSNGYKSFYIYLVEPYLYK